MNHSHSFSGARAMLAAALLFLLLAPSASQAGNPMRVRMDTTMGPIIIELFPDKAPITVENFLAYAKSGAYEGTIFHRVMDGFMIQGGGMDKYMNSILTNDPIVNEANNGLENAPYTVAMARTSDPHSATAQFFINVADNRALNFKSETPQGWGYCVFGRVVGGRPTVDKIKTLATGRNGPHENVPLQPVIITKVTVQE